MADYTIDLTGWLGDVQRDLDACLADLAQVCSAAEQRTYADNLAAHRFGVSRLVLNHAPQLAENASERAARTCFIQAIGKFIGFLDKLIASRRAIETGITITRNIVGHEDLEAYMIEYMDAQIALVARDQALSNPKKIDFFNGLDPTIRTMTLQYFQLRRTMEHHQDTPTAELTYSIRRLALFVENKEVKELPYAVEPGQRVEMRALTEERKYPAGVKIVLSPEDAYDLVFSMRHFIVPEVFRAHLGK